VLRLGALAPGGPPATPWRAHEGADPGVPALVVPSPPEATSGPLAGVPAVLGALVLMAWGVALMALAVRGGGSR